MFRIATYLVAVTLVATSTAACSGSDEERDPANTGDASEAESDGGDTGDAVSDPGQDTEASADTDAGDASDAGGDSDEPGDADAGGDADNGADSDEPGEADASEVAETGGDTSEDAEAGTDGGEDVDPGSDADGDTSEDAGDADASDGDADPGDADSGSDADAGADDATDTGADVGPLVCDDGFAPNEDGTLCENIDECALAADNCDPLTPCNDLDGSFECGACPDGYSDVNEDGTSCENIDECTLAADNCDPLVTCDDTVGSFVCGDCPLGYRDINGDGTRCFAAFESAPDGAPQCYFWGTTHLRTFDGLVYDLQGAGEWNAALDPAETPFAVQVRQQPLAANPYASAVTAVAILVGETTVEIRGGLPASVLVDGETSTIGAEGVDLGVASLHEVAGTIVVSFLSDAQVRITPVGARLDVEIYASPAQIGLTAGLCGDNNDLPVDDVRPPSGEPMFPPIDVQDLYSLHVHAWRVIDGGALFTYAAGSSPATYFDPSFPADYVEAAELADEDRAVYEGDCIAADPGHPYLVEACILDAHYDSLDVALSGVERVQEPELILPLDKPLLFARWQQQGTLSNGTWTVAPDFLSVVQSVNGNPTFFVSPNSYINVVIEGTIAVQTTSDDDIVGFVFGYRSPLRSESDPVGLFDTYLLDWKQLDQSFGGGFSAEGYALSYLNGDFSAGPEPFWVRVSDAIGWSLLATLYGATQGWLDNTVNAFRLLHTAHRVEIWMNGTRIFQQAGDFQSGRFGFYNYSQERVRYADFRVSEVNASTLCGDDYLDPGEECDDGNREPGDGCSELCEIEAP